MSAIEKGYALLRLRGAGATIESIRQMSNIYGEDSNLVPTAFVTDKFQSAKAITAFGGYAVFKGLMTDEQVYEQRDVFGEDYSALDFTLPADQFKKHIDALEQDSLIATVQEAQRKKSLGITVGEQATKVCKSAYDIKVSDMASASLVTIANIEAAIKHLQSLVNYKPVVVKETETAKVLQTA
jgi:hypothetical protein